MGRPFVLLPRFDPLGSVGLPAALDAGSPYPRVISLQPFQDRLADHR